MGRSTSLPLLYDEVLSLSCTNLVKWGYINPGSNQIKSGVISWFRNGEKVSASSIVVDNQYMKITFHYNYQDEKHSITFRLESIKSNLGKGQIWFFRCPHTGLRCRKIYSIGSTFGHRKAFSGVYYSKQILGHKDRFLVSKYDSYFKENEMFQMLYGKHFKKYYKGKPTKRYLKALKILEEANLIDEQTLLNDLLS